MNNETFISTFEEELQLRQLSNLDLSSMTNIDKFCEELTACVQKAIETSTPRVMLRKERNFWWNNELKRLKSNWKKLKRARSPVAKEARQIYEKAIVDAKEAAWAKFLKETEGADESFLRYRILCKKNEGESLAPVLTANGFTKSSTETVQVLLRANFPDLNTNFSQSDLQVINELNEYVSHVTVTEEPQITSCEIKAAINKIKTGKAPGPDSIPGFIIKDLSLHVTPLLASLFNACLALGYFPKSWKTANVIFLQKPGRCLEDPKGRRPISLLSHLAKVFERVLLNRLSFLAGEHGWISNYQFGFRKGVGAQDAALNLASKISTGFKQQMDTLVVFLDIVGAFNDSWPDGVVHRLVTRKCPPTYVKLVRSYLQDRVAQVNTPEGTIQHKLTKSCPQGGVLSPFLYSLFIDELLTDPQICPDLKQGFADDIAIGVQGKNRKRLQYRMNRILNQAMVWAKRWKIDFSVIKTKAVIFSRRRKNETVSLSMGGHKIDLVSEFRYLGIIFDKKLLWKSHIQQQCGKAISLLLKLKAVTKRNWGMPQRTNYFIYKRVIEPILLYGCSVWSKSLDKAEIVALLRRAQRLAALAMTGALKTTSTDTLFVLSGLEPIDFLAKERCALHFIKLTQQEYLLKMLEVQNHLLTHEATHSHDSSLQFMQRCAIDLASYNFGNQFDTIAAVPPWEFPDDLITISDESIPCYDPSSYTYYTDASQQGVGTPVGVAVVLQQSPNAFTDIVQIQLPGYASVFQGELYAIFEALRHIQDIQLKDRFIQIFSDSRSALEALKQFDTKIPIARKIQQQIRELRINNTCDIHLSWVKAHSGIPENEKADLLAKLACINGRPTSRSINALNTHFYSATIRTRTNEHWQRIWNTSSKGRTTFSIIPTTSCSTDVQLLTKQLSNRSRSLIYQAMSAHIPLNDYLYRFHLKTSQRCDSCKADREDITHLLTSCSRYKLMRYEFFSGKNLHETDVNLADYFKPSVLPLTLKILHSRFLHSN
jgi:ribonuclease HI